MVMRDPFFEKGLPSNIEAERSILGAFLLDNSLVGQMDRFEIKRESFFLDSHRRIVGKMIDLFQTGRVIDLITLSEELRRTGEFEQVGGADYIASLIDGVPRTDTIEPYAKIVSVKSKLRQIITESNRTIAEAFDEEDGPEIILARLYERTTPLLRSNTRRKAERLSSIAGRILAEVEEAGGNPGGLIGIDTGYIDLNSITLGWRPKYYIVAARPGMGKSAFAGNTAAYAAKAGKTVLVFTLEMSAEEWAIRFLCSEARVDSIRLLSGNLNRDEWSRLADALLLMETWEIYIEDDAGITPIQMRMRVNEFIFDTGKEPDLLILDYIQLMSADNPTGNENQDLTNISKGLVKCQKEFRCPLIALSQLNRDCENRQDKRPRSSDLRGSGSIEQDADAIIFIYRDEIYGETDENRGMAELIIPKHRGGRRATGDASIKLAFLAPFTRFENLWVGV